MTWVKLCGLRTREDVEVAVEAGADAVGFVLAAGSPRRISVDTARRIGADAAVERYLVTVDVEPGPLLEAAELAGADGVQPHGAHAADAAAAALDAGLRVLFPVPVTDRVALADVPPDARPLLDTHVPGMHGGTGRTFDWDLAADPGRDVVIAGGLTPDTVGVAVGIARPWGVDVSSGIERSPGEKDHALMRRFVEAVR
ncbi:MAG: phosphoribosylanthranilate isomerase [Acidimicrobiia bacterium]|nr:phosphoribosylanthranilate isomerase [Acidimicrobiia bacterium]